MPDLSAEYHLATGFGYVELAGIVRQIQWDDLVDNAEDFSGDATGWGLNLSTNIKTGRIGHDPWPDGLRRRHRELHERRDL